MSRNVFVLTRCDGSPQRVVGSKDWADFILEEDLLVCGVENHKHQIVELELEYDKSQDLREWISDNFDVIKDSIATECNKWCEEHKIPKCRPEESQDLDVVDVDNLADSIGDSLKIGLFKVLESYDDYLK